MGVREVKGYQREWRKVNHLCITKGKGMKCENSPGCPRYSTITPSTPLFLYIRLSQETRHSYALHSDLDCQVRFLFWILTRLLLLLKYYHYEEPSVLKGVS
jgi:hypothetical protein